MAKTPPPPSATDNPVRLRPMTPANDDSSAVSIVAIAIVGFIVVNMVSGSGFGILVVVPAMMMVIMLAIIRAAPSPNERLSYASEGSRCPEQSERTTAGRLLQRAKRCEAEDRPITLRGERRRPGDRGG